jgi:purine-binding chemotaxis protein CheW
VLNLGGRVMGIVVDGVSDVIALDASQIRPVPDLVSSIDTRFLVGLGAVENRMLILVDIERLMTSQEMALMDTVTE